MNWSLLKLSRPSVRTPDVYVNPKREQYIRNPLRQKIQQFKRFIENYRRHIVCFIVVYGIAAGLCLERCYCEWKPLPMCYPLYIFHQVEPFLKKMYVFFFFRLSFPGRVYRHPQDVSGGHRRLSRHGGLHLLPVPLHAPHRVPQPHHPVQRDLPQPIHPLRRRHRLPPFHGHDRHRPVRWGGRIKRSQDVTVKAVTLLLWSVLIVVVHSLGHVVNVYIFSISDLSILSCLFPKVFFNNG